MRLMIFIICLCGIFPLQAQDFLEKNRQEIEQTIVKMEGIIRAGQDTLYAEVQEEDERGRIFGINYIFIFEEDGCVAYRQGMDVHEYWVAEIQELIQMKEGKESGDPLEVCDEQLYAEYDFAGFKMNVSVFDQRLWLDFRIIREE